ncbi:hypothetical protein ma402 [Moumouvirus australiensis]|uniref:Uncharacterized protein n=1 Tax=Moumouvirus australiensis TaxID=2109587 RepID=A0A2P1ELQ3_9VIRU|nr:hypothetical protein QKC55_gp503 [Moumouvirus australiensis]AVL94788.1 hypothetical protein ma402 [Moumouvirus australiensis]
MFSRRITSTSKNLPLNNGFPIIVSNNLCTSYPDIPKSLQNNPAPKNEEEKELESNDLSETLSELYVNMNQ